MDGTDHQQRLARMYASDATADGTFVTGVLSTGIYCLPSCSGKKPLAKNVRVFATPAEARAAGLRPCLRCRPDDFYAGRHPERDRVERLVAGVRADPAAFADPAAMAAAAGFGATKLHALCREHFHTAPAAMLAAARCDEAMRRLARGDAVADAAFAAGFATLSTFHERFRRATGMTPGVYRDLGAAADAAFVLALPRGYLAAPTFRVWGRDPQSPSERVDGHHLARALRTADGGGALLHVTLGDGAARCRVEAAGAVSPATRYAAHRVALRMLGLVTDPLPFERQALRDPARARLVAARQGLRIPLTPDAFEALTWAVLGQQVNLAFAFTLRRQVLELCGAPAPAGFRAHPEPAAVAALDLADLVRRQLSRRKAEYLVGLAAAVASDALPLAALGGAAAGRLEATLVAQRGIGRWTAQYVMLRGFGLADCVPVGDAGLGQALQRFHGLAARPNEAETLRLLAPFAPWRSFATFHLWASLADAALPSIPRPARTPAARRASETAAALAVASPTRPQAAR